MIGALKWLTYVNPMQYAFDTVMSNEFRTLKGECANLVPMGVGYENVTIGNQVCTTVGSVPGQSFVGQYTLIPLKPIAPYPLQLVQGSWSCLTDSPTPMHGG